MKRIKVVECDEIDLEDTLNQLSDDDFFITQIMERQTGHGWIIVAAHIKKEPK